MKGQGSSEQPTVIRLIAHSMRMHLMQSITMVLSIALATAGIATFLQVSLGAERGRIQAEERGGAQFIVIPSGSEQLLSNEDLLFTGAPATMYMPEVTYEKVLSLEGVTRASFQFYSQTLDASCCSAVNPTRLIGIEPLTDYVVAPLLPPGKSLETLLAAGNIILGSEVDGFAGGSGEVLGKQHTVSAVLASTGTSLDHAIIVSIELARSISAAQEGYGHFWEQYGKPENLISVLLVDFDTATDPETATHRLNSLGAVTVIERSAVVERSAAALQAMLVVLAGAGSLMALASFLQLLARMYSMVWERRVEFALYEAIGASKGTVLRLLFGEAGFLLGVGLVVGILLSLLLFPLLFSLAVTSGGSFAFIAPSISEIILINASLIGLFALLAFVSILASLGRLRRIDPSLAMRQTDIG